MINDERVARVAAYMQRNGEHGQDRTNLVDLLANAMHWATTNGVDFDDALLSARNHFSGES